jgi:hypothetical protein
VGGVSVGDEMSPRQNAQTHTRFLRRRGRSYFADAWTIGCTGSRSCGDGNIIVTIMNLWNCRFSVINSKEFTLLWKP